MSDIETLTDEERVYVGHHALSAGKKALRIIDDHAADRAALVARAEAAEQALDRRNAECEDAEIRLREAQADLKTWERTGKALERSENERIAALVAQLEAAREIISNALQLKWFPRDTAAESEAEEFLKGCPAHDALVAQLAELTRERDEWHEAAISEGRAKLRAEKALRQMSTVQEITSANLYSAENKLAAISAETAEHDEDCGLTENECTIRDLKSKVAELTRERDEAREGDGYWHAAAVAEGKAKLRAEGEAIEARGATSCQETGVHKDCDCEDPREVGYGVTSQDQVDSVARKVIDWAKGQRQSDPTHAALVAQLEGARGLLEDWMVDVGGFSGTAQSTRAYLKGWPCKCGMPTCPNCRPRSALVAQVAELTRVAAEAARDRDAVAAHTQRVSARAEALVAQLAELERKYADVATSTRHGERLDEMEARAEAAESEVARLTRERDEAGDARDMARRGWSEAQAEVTRQTKALAAAERERAKEVKRADFFQGEHRNALDETFSVLQRAEAAESRVRELEAALAAAERGQDHAIGKFREAFDRAEAAESQSQRDHQLAAEWKATAEAYRVDAEVTRDRLAALQKQLADANALLADCARGNRAIWPHEARSHLAAQPAAPTRAEDETCDECGAIHGAGNKNRLCSKASDYAPELEAKIAREWPEPTRAEAEQRVLDACANAYLLDGVHPRFAYDGCAELVARAELARREALRG